MRKLIVTLAVAAAMTLAACGAGESDATDRKTYDVTLYGGGTEIRKWAGVSNYTRWSDGCTSIVVDGEAVTVIGGTIVIEESEE